MTWLCFVAFKCRCHYLIELSFLFFFMDKKQTSCCRNVLLLHRTVFFNAQIAISIKQVVVITSCCNIVLFCHVNAQLWFLSSKTIKLFVVITSCCNIMLFCHVNAQQQFHSLNKLKYTGVL